MSFQNSDQITSRKDGATTGNPNIPQQSQVPSQGTNVSATEDVGPDNEGKKNGPKDTLAEIGRGIVAGFGAGKGGEKGTTVRNELGVDEDKEGIDGLEGVKKTGKREGEEKGEEEEDEEQEVYREQPETTQYGRRAAKKSFAPGNY